MFFLTGRSSNHLLDLLLSTNHFISFSTAESGDDGGVLKDTVHLCCGGAERTLRRP
jgi:hypothetical protein